MKNYIYKNYIQIIPTLLVGLSLIFSGPINAQDKIEFNPIAANAELDRLNTQINAFDVSTTSLNAARTQAQEIFNAALVCFDQTSAERERLEIRFAPLEDINADVAPSIFDQRNEIRNSLDEVTAKQIYNLNLQALVLPYNLLSFH